MSEQIEQLEKAIVLGNDNDGWNVKYFDDSGKCVLHAGCIDKGDAEILAETLNNAAWIDVDAEGRL